MHKASTTSHHIHNGESRALRFSALKAPFEMAGGNGREISIFKSSTRRPWGRDRKGTIREYYLGGLGGVPKDLADPCSQGSLSFFLENPEKKYLEE